MDKKFEETWIRHCMFEFVGERLEGMEDYFRKCYRDAVNAGCYDGSYDEWRKMVYMEGTDCDVIGEWWYESFKGKEKEFREFMERVGFSGYVEEFKEDFEVEIIWVCHRGGSCWLRDRLDIKVKML